MGFTGNDIGVDVKGMDEALKTLSAEGARIVVVRTLNKLADKGKTEAKRKITEGWWIRPSDIDLKVTKANPKSGAIDVAIRASNRDKRYPLDHFKYKQTPAGVLVSMKKGSPDILYRHAFVSTMHSNSKTGIFERKVPWISGPKSEKERNELRKIRKLFAPSVADIFDGRVVREHVQESINEVAEKIFEHEFDFFTRNGGR